MCVSEEAAVYDALAPLYDRIMMHVQYGEWAALIERIVARFANIGTPKILEIGAGTGILGSLLQANGFQYIGSDRSVGMCRQACSRIKKTLCADGRRLPFKHQFDLVCFLYDGINYLHSKEEYETLLREVHSCLVTQGLFLFDVTTRANSIRYFSDHTDFEDFVDGAYIRHSWFDPKTDIQHNDFTIFSIAEHCPGHFSRSFEHHQQKLFATSTLRSFIPNDLFQIVGVWDGYTFKPARGDSERIHFLLRKVETV